MAQPRWPSPTGASSALRSTATVCAPAAGWRPQTGTLFLVALERGRIVEDEEVKREVSTRRPYGEWYARNAVPFSQLPPSEQVTLSDLPLRLRQRAFGYSQEDLRVLLAPMASEAGEAGGAMGND